VLSNSNINFLSFRLPLLAANSQTFLSLFLSQNLPLHHHFLCFLLPFQKRFLHQKHIFILTNVFIASIYLAHFHLFLQTFFLANQDTARSFFLLFYFIFHKNLCITVPTSSSKLVFHSSFQTILLHQNLFFTFSQLGNFES